MQTISQLFRTIGPIRFFTRTNRLQLDSDCSVVIRTACTGPLQGQAVVVMFLKRNGTTRPKVTAALFLDWIDEEKFIPYAFFHREQGTTLQLYRKNSRGRIVGTRAAVRTRLVDLMINWDAEITKALNLKRISPPVLQVVKP